MADEMDELEQWLQEDDHEGDDGGCRKQWSLLHKFNVKFDASVYAVCL